METVYGTKPKPGPSAHFGRGVRCSMSGGMRCPSFTGKTLPEQPMAIRPRMKVIEPTNIIHTSRLGMGGLGSAYGK